jgi:hypothetical protein
MIISAKFASVCPCCNARIVPGTKVEWTKGSKARHVTCQPVSTTNMQSPTAPRSRTADCRRYGWDGVRGSSSYYSSGQYDEES